MFSQRTKLVVCKQHNLNEFIQPIKWCPIHKSDKNANMSNVNAKYAFITPSLYFKKTNIVLIVIYNLFQTTLYKNYNFE